MTELALVLDSPASRRRCHSPREEYFTWVRQVFDGSPASVRSRRYFYDRFVRHWPDLEDWFAEPLLVRLDLHDRDCWQSGKRKGPSHEAGTYLAYLSLTHRMPMDVDWLFSRNFDSMFRPQVAVGASPAPPPRPCSTTNSARTPWTGSRATSFKTELELGHCLRLPAEGPCECDLYLRCSKFFTTSEYAPRLRNRLVREQQLIQDAIERNWPREIERHQAITRRIHELMSELGEPCEDPGQDTE